MLEPIYHIFSKNIHYKKYILKLFVFQTNLLKIYFYDAKFQNKYTIINDYVIFNHLIK
jgi:hypothetical protein